MQKLLPTTEIELMIKLTGLIGIVVLLGIAYGLSNNRKAIKPRIVIWGIG